MVNAVITVQAILVSPSRLALLYDIDVICGHVVCGDNGHEANLFFFFLHPGPNKMRLVNGLLW